MKKAFFTLLFCIFFFFLLLFPKQAVQSAADGLILWSGTLVPTLLPIMIVSNILVQSGCCSLLSKPFYPICNRLFGIGIYGTYALICGFLCGFPMGVKVISDLYEKKMIHKTEAHYLCSFCNNVSPAFVLNYLLYSHMPYIKNPFPIMLILYGSPLLYGFLTGNRKQEQTEYSVLSSNKASFTAPDFAMIDACITNGIHSITKLCGYIILFSIAAAIINNTLNVFPILNACLIALTEITSGIHVISNIQYASKFIGILLITVTAFGGLCTAIQSQSMLHAMEMSLHKYLKSRLIITLIALVLSICYFA